MKVIGDRGCDEVGMESGIGTWRTRVGEIGTSANGRTAGLVKRDS